MGTPGNLVAVDLPAAARGGPEVLEMFVPVKADRNGESLASTAFPLALEACPGRLTVGARRVGPTTVRVRVWMFGEAERDVALRYDFGQGDVKVSKERDLTFDYGKEAEGHRFVVSVRPKTSEPGDASTAKKAAAGMEGFAVVMFPNLEGLRATQARIDALQREQNAEARRRGWRQHQRQQ